jgi:hypothetical protein
MLNRNWYTLSFPMGIQKTGTFFVLLVNCVVTIALLGGCQSNTPNAVEASPTVAQKPASSQAVRNIKSQKTQSLPKSKAPRSKTLSAKTVPVNIYQLDNQCNRFVAKKVNVAANQPVTQSIAKVLENLAESDLEVSGYRVKLNKGVATIDLRRSANAKRPLRSFSNCEQLALFGSLRRTLTGNRALKIKSVQFSDRGQPIKPQ